MKRIIDPVVLSSASMLPPALRCGSAESSEHLYEDDPPELPPHEEEEAGWGARGWEVFRDIDY